MADQTNTRWVPGWPDQPRVDDPGPVFAAALDAMRAEVTTEAHVPSWAFAPASSDPDATFGGEFPVLGIEDVPTPALDDLPRRFALDRWNDPSGISGCGRVAYGVMWSDGRVVTRWLGTTTGVTQVCVWDSLDDLLRIHAHGGRSAVTWIDPPAPHGILR